MRDDDAPGRGHGSPSGSVRPVEDDQWPMVAWLYQLFRHVLALVVRGLPYADGRYNHRLLDAYPSPDHHGYLVWRDHPNTARPAPVGFALCERVSPVRWSVGAFWVSPVVRGEGVGTRLALDVLGRHGPEWEVAFQHDNAAAGRFWRRVADASFGPGGWSERRQPVPHRPDAPADHVIASPAPPH